MESNPKISVVLICFNHEEYINEAVNSILSQTYSDFELIIVDDGSRDDTLRIIQGFSDPRILIIEQDNYGPSVALNAGIEKSRGNYIAFMSGDDVSYPHRFDSQIKQLEIHNADIIFSLPQIIGPHSEFLAGGVCPWFFGREFESTAELYSHLFFFGNFLCAPSCFCRRTALEKVGRFKRGLLQLQDFDYWIRVCKKGLIIKLFKNPLIQYRHLYGANLSDKANMNRVLVEKFSIYSSFFDEAPIDLLRKAFGERITSDALDNSLELEIDKSFLLLNHPDADIKAIGAERMIRQLEEDEIYERLIHGRSFEIAEFFRITNTINLEDSFTISRSKRLYRSIRVFVADFLKINLHAGPILTDLQAKQAIQGCLERGEYRRAVSLINLIRVVPPASTRIGTFRKLIFKLWKKLVNILTTIKAFANRVIIAQSDKVYTLARMYDYSKKANRIVYEETPERVYLKTPKVIGIDADKIAEGEAYCPRPYVSILDDAVVTGGSNFVISHNGILLDDELVDFPGEEYGIKSPHVRFRYKDKVILRYEKRPRIRIKEGILLSCGHDFNYFHWLLECLPKLLLIDSLKQFKDAPLLIPKGLHRNLEAALGRINVNDRRLIRLDKGVAYQVNRLICPSALSRIVDRYMGEVIFNADIVLSHQWISKVSDKLTAGTQSTMKPWRKLYLQRRQDYRFLENQDELEYMLLKHEFEMVELDGVSLDFQIELFSQAAIIVAPTGAALTNMLFCKPGTKVLIFMSNHKITNYYFWSQLGDIVGVDVNIIAGERLYNLTNIYSVHDDYRIDPKIALEEIMKFERG